MVSTNFQPDCLRNRSIANALGTGSITLESAQSLHSSIDKYATHPQTIRDILIKLQISRPVVMCDYALPVVSFLGRRRLTNILHIPEHIVVPTVAVHREVNDRINARTNAFHYRE